MKLVYEFKNKPHNGDILIFEDEKIISISKEELLRELKADVIDLRVDLQTALKRVRELEGQVKELRGED